MDKLNKIRKKAKSIGIKGDIVKSSNPNKKYDLVIGNKKTSFGAKGYEDYLDHQDLKRRKNYRARHSGIVNKDGRKAISVKNSPAYLSYNLLW